MTLDNKTIGYNIAKLRRLKEIKAADIAAQLGLKEASYTKYERGETAITIDFLKKVAEILEVAPINIIRLPIESIFRYLQTSPSKFGNDWPNFDYNSEKRGIAEVLILIAELNKSVLTIIGKE